MAARRKSLHLSKSRFMAGRQCEKRRWLEVHRRGLATPPDVAQQARFARGSEIGERARGLFPGGVLIEESAFRHAAACQRTRALLAEDSIPALFEAAFEHRGVRVRADVLERLPGGRWRLIEVKSSTKAKEEHLDDIAVQCFTLRGAGLDVVEMALLHLDNGYVRGVDGIDWPRLFALEDLTARVEARLAELDGRVEAMHAVLSKSRAPRVMPDAHCSKPYDCPFWEHCTRRKPEDWIFRLPEKGKLHARLEAAGIQRISEIPDDWPLSGRAERARRAVQRGAPFVSTELGAALARLGPPAYYLDFESVIPAAPLYAGTRPYQHIPFQWSLHHWDAAGGVTHRGVLAEAREDPRRAVAETLLAALEGNDDPILVYSSYEASRIAGLADALPDLAARLRDLDARLRDLLEVVRDHVYHVGFAGSFSIKNVAPALVPAFSYAGLDGVASGGEAPLAFEKLATGEASGALAADLRQALEAYCQRDTEALLEIHRALRAAS